MLSIGSSFLFRLLSKTLISPDDLSVILSAWDETKMLIYHVSMFCLRLQEASTPFCAEMLSLFLLSRMD